MAECRSARSKIFKTVKKFLTTNNTFDSPEDSKMIASAYYKIFAGYIISVLKKLFTKIVAIRLCIAQQFSAFSLFLVLYLKKKNAKQYPVDICNNFFL